MKPRVTSMVIYAGCALYLAVARVLFTWFPVELKNAGQAADLAWPVIAAVAVAGLLGRAAALRAGLPDLIEPDVSHRERFLAPIGIGVGFGAAICLLDLVTPLGIDLNVRFPMALVLYPFGGVLTEIVYRLVALPVPLWLAGALFPRARGAAATYWVVAGLTSLLEPIGQLGAVQVTPGVAATLFVHAYAFNLVLAALFRRAGFLAPLTMRLAYYVPWHLLRG